MHSMLAARTDFSLGESIIDTERLVKAAKDAGQTAVAMTDTMSITGMIDFTNRAKKAELKPIIGCRLRLTDQPTWRPGPGEKKKDMPPSYFITVYALTEAGMQAIFRLLTLANEGDTTDAAGNTMPGRFYYEPKLGFEDLWAELRANSEGLAVVLGDTFSPLRHPDFENAVLNPLANLHLPHAYAPLVPVDTPYFTQMNQLALEVINRGILQPLVVRPAFYIEGENEADAHELMGAIANNNKITDGWHKSMHNRDFHLVGTVELIHHVKKAAGRIEQRGLPKPGAIFLRGLENTKILVDAVTYQWAKAPVSLPKMAENEFASVVAESKKGWAARFGTETFGHKPTEEELNNVYKPRLAYELSVLQKLNFSGYFLLVQDVVQFAKKNDILVGPGRGSVGGSLVAYLMGITDCDPIRFGLLFERFINPERIDLPDADLDFMSDRRHEVVEYLVKKYGDKRVAGVSNFGTLAAASSIRDVGRVMGMNERDYSVSKLVPKLHGANVPLPECRKAVPEIDSFANNHPAVWPIMERLEGTIRNFSQHAAGIVVGGVDLVERGVIERRKDGNVVCWDKRIVEDQGLVKMDILGLRTLDVIKLTLDYIFERKSKKIDLMRIPLDDKTVLENFAAGRTTAIFQFESGGMRRLLKELGADGTITFDDITAATALYRPGPMESGMMDSFYLRKQGNEPIDYDHPLMEQVLNETFGVIVYQEQVMKISQVVAGYTGAQADKLRKIMGKKLPEEMAKERGNFVQGCVNTIGAEERWAGELFDKIEGFAGYGFNKSHSVEYTLISYQAMWLKTNFPVEFYAAALSLFPEDKLTQIIRDAKSFGIDVSMPDINISTGRFEIATDVRLVMPLQRIKGISANTTNAVLEARKAGPFKDKADFIARVERRKCNVSHQDKLDKVGAFSRIEPSQLRADDPSRIKDQIELLPGLMTAYVPVDREMFTDKDTKKAIAEIVDEYRATHGPGSENPDGMPVKPTFGKNAQFMIISDAPGGEEDQAGMMGFSMSNNSVVDAMSEHDLDRSQAYWTALLKRPKRGKMITAEELAIYTPYLQREIDTLKPTVIVLLGSTAVRSFFPDFKGKASDQAGKVIYDKDLDANVVIGFSPGEIYFNPDKQTNMIEVFASVAELLS